MKEYEQQLFKLHFDIVDFFSKLAFHALNSVQPVCDLNASFANVVKDASVTWWVEHDLFAPASPEHIKKISARSFELMSARMYVCVHVFISFHRNGLSWLNKTINVMPEIRPAMLCWGNISVSRTFVAAL